MPSLQPKKIRFGSFHEIANGALRCVDTPIRHMREKVFPLAEHESKELFRQHCRPGGPLPRQQCGSMRQFVSRRRRCWSLLVQVDLVIFFSEGHRSDMLLDLTRGDRDFDRVAEALIIQQPPETWPETRGKEKAKAKTAPCAVAASRPVGLGAKARVKQLRIMRTMRPKTTTQLSSQVLIRHTTTALNPVAMRETTCQAAERDAIALLADTCGVDLMSDPELSAQLVQSNAQAKGKYFVRPSHLSKEDRRRRVKDLKAKTECRACGRKGHWANDRECTMSSTRSSSQNATRTARMTVRFKSKTCYIFFNDADDPTAFMASKEVSLPALVRQTHLTPRAADIPITDLTMNDDDDPRSKEADHRHCWSKQFTTGACRGMKWGVVLGDFPKHVFPLVKSKKVPEHLSEFFYWGQKHYFIDAVTSTLEGKQPEPSSHEVCVGGCKEFSLTGSTDRFIRTTCKICGTVHNKIPRNVLINTRTTEVVMRIPGSFIASIAEHTFVLFHTEFTMDS